VLVRLVVNDQTTLKDSTDASGYYSISGIPSGYYWIIFSKTGYATVRANVYITVPNDVANTTNGKKQSFDYGDIQDAALAPVTGKINGLVTLNGAPAASANVIANVDDYFASSTCSLEPAYYTTTTDANGAYSFSNLPVGCTITCTAYSGNASGSNAGSALGLGQTITPLHVGNIAISEEELYLLSYTGQGTNVKIDTTTASIVLTFSENISEAITKSKTDGHVKITAGSNDVLTTATYSGQTITLTLTAGTLTSKQTYTIDFKVYASDNKFAQGTPTFTTKERSAVIAATVATLAYTDPNLIVTSLPAITGMPSGKLLDFDVYYKSIYSDQMDFRKIATGTPIGTTTTMTIGPPSGGYLPGSYYVVPKVTGLDGVTVYGVPSNVAVRPGP